MTSGPPPKDHIVPFSLPTHASGILPDRMIAAMADALIAHRDFGDLQLITFPRTARHRPWVTAVRGALAIRDSRPRQAPVGRCSGRLRPPTDS